MGYIDLHTHSNASDGTLSPDELIRLGKELNLSALALTDHDTVSGLKQAKKIADELSFFLIPGVELSCSYLGTEIHILGLFVDPTHQGFVKELHQLNEKRIARNEEMRNRFLQHGILLTPKDLSDNPEHTVITRAHFAMALLKKGYVKDYNQAFKKYLGPNSACYLPKETIDPAFALELIHSCNGFSCLAHPMLYKLGKQELDFMIGELTKLGLSGLEVYHSSHRAYESQQLQVLAKKYGLLPTGGSDFHGENKPDIQLGKGRGGLRVCDQLLFEIMEKRNYIFPSSISFASSSAK